MKPLRNIALVAALTLAFGAPCVALDLPEHSKKDHRVRYVNYDPADVIQLDAVVGVATHIQLEKGEHYVYHVFGDAEAYDFTHESNHLFFKPIADQADTNLTVITNLREYTFRISYHNDRNSKALYKLVLRYPDSVAAEAAAVEARREIEQAWDKGKVSSYNWHTYMKSGALELAPIHAWDDGRHTSMQFAPHAELPVIYYVDAEGQESIANYHMADANTVVLHRTAAKWYLRLGGRVAAIHNQGFGTLPKPPETGTVSSKVIRVVDGETPTLPQRRSESMFNNGVAYDFAPGVLATANSAEPAAVTPIPPAAPAQAANPVTTSSNSNGVPGTEVEPKPKADNGSSASVNQAAEASGYKVVMGDSTLLPKQITVEQGHTKFRFASPDLPIVRPLNENGKELLVGMHVEPNNVIVVHADSDTWQLQKDDSRLLLQRGQ